MKAILIIAAAGALLAGDWDQVKRIPPGQRIEISTRDRVRLRAGFVSATDDAVVVRAASGERSIDRQSIRALRVRDSGRRLRNGVIGTAVGIAAGVGIGFAVCPYCPNEGAGYKYVGPGLAIGAAVGAAAGFIPAPFRTVYKSK